MSRLKELRTIHSFTQDVVASHIGITRAAYTNLENGKRQCDASTLLKLSELYNVSVGCILGVEPIEEKENQHTLIPGMLDDDLIQILTNLTQQEAQRVRDFVNGMRTANKNG